MCLQEALYALQEWTDTWLLKYNTDKCSVLSVGKCENVTYNHNYETYNNTLEFAFEEKDVGVTTDLEPTFNEYIHAKVKKGKLDDGPNKNL